jgi:DNA-binding LacI/PurR family transcriptional regulator
MDSSAKIIRDPVYKQFKAVIKDILLKQNRWSAGQQIAPERELADEFKLSRVTISKALSELEAEGLIEKRPPGGTFVTEKVKSRGLVKFLFYLPQPLSLYPGYALVLSVLESKLAAQGVGLIYTSTMTEELAQTRATVVVGAVGPAALQNASRIPTVTVDYGSFVEGVAGVEIDNAMGAQKAVEFLYKKGHRRIGYLGCFQATESDEWPNSERRRAGYLAALKKLDLEINPAFQRLSWAESKSSLQVAQEILSLPSGPTALLCFSEIQAIGALEGSRAKPAKRGRVFETVCFADNASDAPVEGLAGYCVVPWRTIAGKTAELVLQSLEKPQFKKAAHIVVTPEMIESVSA